MSITVSVNGVDIKRQYGICLLQGSIASLLGLPARKEVLRNEWWEWDGIEVDLSEIAVYQPRRIVLKFSSSGGFDRRMSFLNLLTDNTPYVDLSVSEAGKTFVNYNLRLTLENSLSSVCMLDIFELAFMLDSEVFSDVAVIANYTSGYLLDGIDFGNFGIRILQGSEESARKSADVKPNLLLDDRSFNGAIYDNSLVSLKSRNITLKCLVKSASFTAIRNKLLYALSQPGLRVISIPDLDLQLPCYYTSGSTGELFYEDGWWKFDLNFTVTDTAIIDGVLLAESGKYLATQNDKYISL